MGRSGHRTAPSPLRGVRDARASSHMTSTTIRFGTGTTVHDFGFYREWLSVADDARFDVLTVGDSQSLWADPFVCLTVAAQATQGARLAVTVSNPKTRHP